MRLIHTWLIINQVLPRAALCAKPGIPARTNPSFTRASEPELHPCDEWKCFPQTFGNFLAPVKQHNKCCQSGWRVGSKADVLPAAAVCWSRKVSVFPGPRLPGQRPVSSSKKSHLLVR